MAVKIRLKRLGRKKRPYYRIVAIDSRVRRDGVELERLGWYDPLANNGDQVRLNEERILHWLSEGAQPTDTMKNLMSSKGLSLKWHLMQQGASEAEIETALAEWGKAQEEKAKRREAKQAQNLREKKEKAKPQTAEKSAAAGEPAIEKAAAEPEAQIEPAEAAVEQAAETAEEAQAPVGETAGPAKAEAEAPTTDEVAGQVESPKQDAAPEAQMEPDQGKADSGVEATETAQPAGGPAAEPEAQIEPAEATAEQAAEATGETTEAPEKAPEEEAAAEAGDKPDDEVSKE